MSNTRASLRNTHGVLIRRSSKAAIARVLWRLVELTCDQPPDYATVYCEELELSISRLAGEICEYWVEHNAQVECFRTARPAIERFWEFYGGRT